VSYTSQARSGTVSVMALGVLRWSRMLLTCSGVRLASSESNRAAAPATCGQAIDVPLIA